MTFIIPSTFRCPVANKTTGWWLKQQHIPTVLLFLLLQQTHYTEVVSSSFLQTNPSFLFPLGYRRYDPGSPTTTTTTTTYPTSIITNTILEAKTSNQKKKKSKTKSGGSEFGGGFGKKVAVAPPPPSRENDDYAAFPALEDSVKATLVPSGEKDGGGEQQLSDEIYDRLAQIYGFEHFNYDYAPSEKGSGDDDNTVMSFDELLSSNRDSSSTLSSSSKGPSLSSSDLTDLIASATGGGATTTPSTDTPPSSSESSTDISQHLTKLPPFQHIRVLHIDPLVLSIDDFFTPNECDTYRALTENPPPSDSKKGRPVMVRSKTVGKDTMAKSQRTSTTWFHTYETVPELMAKSCRLLGLDTLDRWEEPQTVRYRGTEQYTWHLDALAPSEDLEQLGGQRIATLLVYLNDLTEEEGGATMFRDLGDSQGFLKVRPKKGSALLFFPAAGGIPNVPFDIRTLHAGEAVTANSKQDKWIAQLWLRKGMYRPTAPPGNTHDGALEAIGEYCDGAVSD